MYSRTRFWVGSRGQSALWLPLGTGVSSPLEYQNLTMSHSREGGDCRLLNPRRSHPNKVATGRPEGEP